MQLRAKFCLPKIIELRKGDPSKILILLLSLFRWLLKWWEPLPFPDLIIFAVDTVKKKHVKIFQPMNFPRQERERPRRDTVSSWQQDNISDISQQWKTHKTALLALKLDKICAIPYKVLPSNKVSKKHQEGRIIQIHSIEHDILYRCLSNLNCRCDLLLWNDLSNHTIYNS